jgi:hypothetical protein
VAPLDCVIEGVGVAVWVGAEVADGVGVPVLEGVGFAELVDVGVAVALWVGLLVPVGEGVGKAVAVVDGVSLGVGRGVTDGVGEGTPVAATGTSSSHAFGGSPLPLVVALLSSKSWAPLEPSSKPGAVEPAPPSSSGGGMSEPVPESSQGLVEGTSFFRGESVPLVISSPMTTSPVVMCSSSAEVLTGSSLGCGGTEPLGSGIGELEGAGMNEGSGSGSVVSLPPMTGPLLGTASSYRVVGSSSKVSGGAVAPSSSGRFTSS